MTKQILAFLFYFIRELNLYSPLTYSLTLHARTQTFTPPLPTPSPSTHELEPLLPSYPHPQSTHLPKEFKKNLIWSFR
jgi:hypothetical protein